MTNPPEQRDIERAAFEEYCLEYGYSLDGSDRAEGRWAGWQAACEYMRQLPGQDGELVEVLEWAKEALQHSAATHSFYPEPIERHNKALSAVTTLLGKLQ